MYCIGISYMITNDKTNTWNQFTCIFNTYFQVSNMYVNVMNTYVLHCWTNRPWIFVLKKNMTERIFTSLMRCWIVYLGVSCCLRQSGHNNEYQQCLKPEVSKLQNSNYLYLLNFKMLDNVDSRACVCMCVCLCVILIIFTHLHDPYCKCRLLLSVMIDWPIW